MTVEMTIEEAIKRLKEARTTIQPFRYTDEAIDYAIKALDQESILDRIRDEIEQTAKDYDKFDDYRRVRGLWIALEIIDKYRESEE